MGVLLVNPKTGEQKSIALVWKPPMRFTRFPALPVFVYLLLERRKYRWVVPVFTVMGISFLVMKFAAADSTLAWIGEFLFLLSLLFVFVSMLFVWEKGNASEGKKLIREGWEFVYPDSGEARRARKEWGLDD